MIVFHKSRSRGRTRAKFPTAAVGTIVVFILSLTWALPTVAQSPEYELPEGRTYTPPDSGYAVPDVPEGTLEKANVEKEHFTLKLGLSILGDYTSFSQDSDSVVQVGNQENKSEFRSFRLILRGEFPRLMHTAYMVAAEYKGFSQEVGDDVWSISDLNLSWKLSGETTLRIGRQKEGHSYEMVGAAANLPHQERILSPFFSSRAGGVSVLSAFAQQRGTINAGVFDPGWLSSNSNAAHGLDGTIRLTYLPFMTENETSFLHFGASYRYQSRDNDRLRYQGKPESHVSDVYVDTGDIDAGHADHFGFEFLVNRGSVSVLGEMIAAKVDASGGNLGFSGWYLTGSYVLTGETRPYDRTSGYARRVMPEGRWGAWEIVARIGSIDLVDGDIDGGKLERYSVGLNWWATRRWKMGLTAGLNSLDRSGISGRSKSMLFRLQWVH